MVEGVVVVRGAGDIATGVIQKLVRSGFKVLALECEYPSAIRRKVAFSEAVYDGTAFVEGIKAERIGEVQDIYKVWGNGEIPVAIDGEGRNISILKPVAVIDAIIAKRNLGTNKAMAPITIALGPGFTAGVDVDVVIETMRGHNLGRLIFDGEAMPNTGLPGKIGGYSKERVIHAPTSGIITIRREIGDIVEQGELIGEIDGTLVRATISGVLRGIIRNNFRVTKGLKIADIDPRIEETDNCFTISDKARSIGGAALEALLYMMNKKRNEV